MATVKVKDNTNQVATMMEARSNTFLRFMGDAIKALAKSKTPKDKGNLRQDVVITIGKLKGEIAWNKKYAQIQESRRFQNYTTPGTGPHYAQNAVKDAASKKTASVAKMAGLS